MTGSGDSRSRSTTRWLPGGRWLYHSVAHRVLVCFGVALPAMIFVVHRRGLREGDQIALELAHKWAKAAAVLFAVGAVSGTVLSVRDGPAVARAMSRYGDVLGLPFALEGIAFFVEAIFMGIYLYGWGRLPPRLHLYTLNPMWPPGVFGTFCVLAVNAWMNAPAASASPPTEAYRRRAVGGNVQRRRLAAVLHMFVACYIVTGFLTAAVYATGMLRGRRDGTTSRLHRAPHVRRHRRAVPTAQRPLRRHAPVLRPAEQVGRDGAGDNLRGAVPRCSVGGILIDGEVRYAIPIPSSDRCCRERVRPRRPGFDEFPPEDRPPATIVHLSFQTMIGAGSLMVAITL